jgi:FMN-dependent NADH-azoreductase
MKLLHLDSSIQGEASVSRVVTAAIVSRLAAENGGIAVTYRDLVATPLPHLTLDRFASEEGQQVLDEFLAADIVVIGAPMYNFGLATQLKAWIDHIAVAGKTFRYGPTGAEGLAGDKRVIVALSRGGIYSDGSPQADIEHAERYLRAVLAFFGINDPEFIVAEGVALGPDHREAALTGALAAVEDVALAD